MNNLLAYLIVAHLVGDFLLQDDDMQSKSRCSFTCSVHVGFYAIPFFFLWLNDAITWWQVALILAQHWAQDRFGLHLKWMKFWGHTPPDRWPCGPLCIDQTMHLAWIALVAALSPHLS